MIKLLCTTIILCGICLINPAFGQAKATDRAEDIFSFAEHLFAEGEYYRAITEYKRLLFHYPQHPKTGEARLQIGNCYLRGGQYAEAIAHFQSLLTLSLPEKINSKLLYKIAEAYYEKGEYTNARRQLETLINQFPNAAELDEAHYLIGRSYLSQADWQKAAAEFGQIEKGVDAEGLSQEAFKGADLPYKSPKLAGGLSAVVPGLGQLYAGHKQDALVALLLNGAFIWGTIESFRHDNDVAGGILLFFELGWYGGNIYSAVSSTHKYNKKLEDDFREELNSRFKFSLGSLQGNIGQPYIGLSYSF
jgi:outer membrane protein assembly factor BamD (BamD/ComL family)